jgi:hypothetical protein
MGIALASPVGPTALVTELIHAQAFHVIAPNALFHAIAAIWTHLCVFVDPMECEFVDFIIIVVVDDGCPSFDCSLPHHPRTEGPAHESKDVALLIPTRQKGHVGPTLRRPEDSVLSTHLTRQFPQL